MSVKPLRSLTEFPDEYELVILPGGAQILRERQTKAQARIQALRVKSRNDKLRQSLMLLSNEAPKKSTDIQKPVEMVPNNYTKPNLNDKLSLATNINAPSAIQKQMIRKSEVKTDRHEVTNSNNKYQAKSAKFNALNLRRMMFGEQINE